MNCVLKTKQYCSTETAMATWSDESLIAAFCNQQNHSEAAFAALSSRHRDWIYRRSLFRLGNHHDAEDATQDILLRVHAYLHQFEGRAQFKSWLSSIINNYCNTFATRRARYITSDQLETQLELQEQEEALDPFEAIAEEELVQQALSAMPENAREVLSLRFYAEMSLEEISNILQITLSATKARLYRAIELLKKLYLRLECNNLTPHLPENSIKCLAETTGS